MLVLSYGGRVADTTLYTMGLKDPDELEKMVKAFAEGSNVEVDDTRNQYDYEDFLKIRFRLLCSADLYTYDREYKVWTDRSEDARFVNSLVEKAEELSIVGVVRPKEDSSSPVLQMGIGYPASLIDHLMERASDSEIVRNQQADPGINVFTGLPFGEEPDREGMDMSTLFSVDEDAIADAFTIDENAMEIDPSLLDLSGLDFSQMDMNSVLRPEDLAVNMPSLSADDIRALIGSVNVNVTLPMLENLFRELLDSFLEYSSADPATDYAKLPESLREFMETQTARDILLQDIQAILSENSQNLITPEQLIAIVQEVMSGYPAFLAENGYIGEEDPFAHLEEYLRTPAVSEIVQRNAQALAEQLSGMVITQEQLDKVIRDLMDAYQAYAEENALPDPARFQDAFTEFMGTQQARDIISRGVASAIDTSALEAKAAEMFAGYSNAMSQQISAMLSRVIRALSGYISGAITNNLGTLMKSMTENFMNAFRVDGEALAKAFSMNMDPEELRDLMSSLMSREQATYDGNLKKLGYADPVVPSTITIYPTDFNGKAAVKEILERYNDIQRSLDRDDKVITYTDVVDTLMSSVTGIVNAISYVLIAFVAISLVVSSVMIGVITYISVLERKKEIGILRAIGASKRNISQVFNAETFIIGALAGIFGIAITLVLLVPANHIIHNLTEQTAISAALPPGAAVLLILLSIVLTLIGGIIPSMKAAKSDPVAALRSE